MQTQGPPECCDASEADERPNQTPPTALRLSLDDCFGCYNYFRRTPVDITCVDLLFPSVPAYPKVKSELPSRID